MDLTNPIYEKYSAFTEIMLEDHDPLEIAAVMTVQGLGIYKTLLSKEDYNKMVDNISDLRESVKKL